MTIISPERVSWLSIVRKVYKMSNLNEVGSSTRRHSTVA